MLKNSRPLLLAGAGVLALSACDPAMMNNPDNQRTRQGAMIGAGIGALAGAAQADNDDRLRDALIGGAIGGAAGAGIGALLDRQARELRTGFDNQQIDVVNTGSELIVRMPQDILFAVDSTSVSPTLRGDLSVLAANLQRYPNSQVRIVGHTDNTGSAAYNQDLSERRALAVASILRAEGVSPGRLQAIGRGEDAPIASNLTPEGRALNRRVDIVIQPTV